MTIQSQIDAVYAAGGGTVILPAGIVPSNQQITIKRGVELIGSGKVGYNYHTAGIEGGTIIQVNWGAAPGAAGNIAYAAVVMEAGSSIRNIGFDYPQQNVNESTPVEYGSTIQTRDTYYNDYTITIDGCYFFKSYIGIDCRASKGSTGCSNLYIKDCVGSPVYCGIAIDGVTDWQTIENCQFNSGFLGNNRTPLVGWALTNGVGILIGGNDWLQLNNIQIFGYGTGAKITGQLGYAGSGPYSFNFCQFDGCRIGIELNGNIHLPVKVNSCNFAPYNWVTGGQGSALSSNGANVYGGIQFTNNFVFSSPLFGIWLGNGTINNVLVSGNIIQTTGSAGCGVTVIGAHNVQIYNNVVQGFQGISYTSGSNPVIVKDNQS